MSHLERLAELASSHPPKQFVERRAWAQERAAALRTQRLKDAQRGEARPNQVRPWLVADVLDKSLERRGGGMVMIEQYVVPQTPSVVPDGGGKNVYIRGCRWV